MKSFLYTFALALILNHSLCAQKLSDKQLKIVSTHFVNLEADRSYLNANWESVLNAVKNKRIVLIGEFNHGSKEIFITRNELIQQLHEKLGFDLILFESGLGELEVVNLNMRELSPKELTLGFFEPWRTKEFEDLMKYIQQNEITISGFDVQRTGSTFTNYLSEKFDNKIFKETDEQFVALKSQLSNYKTVYDSIKPTTLQLINVYQKLLHNEHQHVQCPQL